MRRNRTVTIDILFSAEALVKRLQEGYDVLPLALAAR
jgi:hypothetical protein